MNFKDVITGKNITKKLGKFELKVPELHVPEGYATALVGENGAGKSTLLNILSGIRQDFKGELTILGVDGTDVKSKAYADMRNKVGYTGGDYYFPDWTVQQVKEATGLLFQGFHEDRFEALCQELAIPTDKVGKDWKKVSELSDGNRMKLEIAGVLARDTNLLLMDEPASPLDPLMRDKLCDLIRNYLEAGAGKKTVLFSTHNISDMEDVTDYMILVEGGQIIEEGFTEDLKEKYSVVRAEKEDKEDLKNVMIGMRESSFGIEGLMKAEDLHLAENVGAVTERPTLNDIVVALMKQHTNLVI